MAGEGLLMGLTDGGLGAVMIHGYLARWLGEQVGESCLEMPVGWDRD